MRLSILALTAGACLLAAGTVIAEPGHPRPVDVELCHEYARNPTHAGTGSLQAGTTFSALVEAAQCQSASGTECVINYCYGSEGASATAAITRGEGLSKR